jgi:hypothetical protein
LSISPEGMDSCCFNPLPKISLRQRTMEMERSNVRYAPVLFRRRSARFIPRTPTPLPKIPRIPGLHSQIGDQDKTCRIKSLSDFAEGRPVILMVNRHPLKTTVFGDKSRPFGTNIGLFDGFERVKRPRKASCLRLSRQGRVERGPSTTRYTDPGNAMSGFT